MYKIFLYNSLFLTYTIVKMNIRADINKDTASIIFDTLKKEILDLTLKPSEEVSENMLTKRFNASRTPVRTAIQRLADMDLIDIAPYQYTKVSLIDYSIARQMIFLRSVMEERVISEFINKADLFLIEDLEHILRKQEILLSSSSFNASDFYNLDTAFHSLFFRDMNCLYIWNMIQDSVHYTRLRMLDIVEVKDFISIYEEHVKMLGIIKTMDKKDLPALLSAHLNGGVRRIHERSNGDYDKYFRNFK